MSSKCVKCVYWEFDYANNEFSCVNKGSMYHRSSIERDECMDFKSYLFYIKEEV